MSPRERLQPHLLPDEVVLWAGAADPLRVLAATLAFAVPGMALVAMGFLAYGSGVRSVIRAVGWEDYTPEMSITVGGAVLTLLLVWAGLQQFLSAARFPARAFDDVCVTDRRVVVRRFRSRGAMSWMPGRDMRSVRSEPFALRIPIDGKGDFTIVGIADREAVHAALARSILANPSAEPPRSR